MKKPYRKYAPPFYRVSPVTCQMRDLVKRVEPAEAEKEWFYHDPLGRVPPLPFGHLNAAWKEFLYEIYIDCELWEFKITGYSVRDSVTMSKPHDPNCGVRGYAVVQRGNVIAEFFAEWF